MNLFNPNRRIERKLGLQKRVYYKCNLLKGSGYKELKRTP